MSGKAEKWEHLIPALSPLLRNAEREKTREPGVVTGGPAPRLFTIFLHFLLVAICITTDSLPGSASTEA
jgi:hypothetical protein